VSLGDRVRGADGVVLAATGLILAVALVGCASLTPTPPDRSGAPSPDARAERPVDVALAEAALWPVLAPAGRDVLAVIDPEEWIEAMIDVGDSEQVAARAVEHGLTAQVVNAGTVLVVGRRNDVIHFAATVMPGNVEIFEDHRPDRWLPERMPPAAIARSASPYRFAPLAVDRTTLRMTEGHKTALLGELSRVITTIGGRPYDRLTVEGECDPGPVPVCQIRASGVTIGAGGQADSFMIVSDASTGGEPQLASSGFQSVQRELARAAEWIARDDPVAKAAIDGYDTCCGSTWDPTRAGVITMSWTRPCAVSVAPAGRPIAATGDCFDTLTIVVDVGRAVVVSIDRRSGP
jgi:hypothetical protein